MAEVSPRMGRRMGAGLMVGMVLVEFALGFVFLTVTYLVLAAIAPGVLGAVAASPARFAAWIALVKLPMSFVHMLAVTWRGWIGLARTGEIVEPPAWKRGRPTLVTATDVALTALAALVVFDRVADPGDAPFWLLVAVTAAGPFLLPRSVAGLIWLLRRGWRRKQASPGVEVDTHSV